MQGENKFIDGELAVLVFSYEKAKITQEHTWGIRPLNLFLGFHYERGKAKNAQQL